jgi:hypothetical protein
MFQEADIDLAGFQQLDAQVTADQDFRPARQKVLTALIASRSGGGSQNEINWPHFINRAGSWLPVGSGRRPSAICSRPNRNSPKLRLGIRRLGEIAAGFMTIDEMTEVTKEAAAQCGDPSVREVIVDKHWDGLRDRNGDYWIA